MRVGVATAAVVMLIGYILMVVKHSTGYPGGTFPNNINGDLPRNYSVKTICNYDGRNLLINLDPRIAGCNFDLHVL